MERSLGRFTRDCIEIVTCFMLGMGRFMSMPRTNVPQHPTVAPPVLRRRPHVAHATFDLDLKIGLLESIILCDVDMLAFGADHNMHAIV